MSAKGHKQTFVAAFGYVRFRGESGRNSLPNRRSAISQERTFMFGGDQPSLTGKSGGELLVLEAPDYRGHSYLASAHHWRQARMS